MAITVGTSAGNKASTSPVLGLPANNKFKKGEIGTAQGNKTFFNSAPTWYASVSPSNGSQTVKKGSSVTFAFSGSVVDPNHDHVGGNSYHWVTDSSSPYATIVLGADGGSTRTVTVTGQSPGTFAIGADLFITDDSGTTRESGSSSTSGRVVVTVTN